jgi:hypothetical protein
MSSLRSVSYRRWVGSMKLNWRDWAEEAETLGLLLRTIRSTGIWRESTSRTGELDQTVGLASEFSS